MTETTRPAAVPADEALLSRSDDLLQDFDRAFRMFHEFVTGTLFETVTLVQGKIRHFLIVAMGRDYWQGMLDFISDTMFREGAAAEGEVGDSC